MSENNGHMSLNLSSNFDKYLILKNYKEKIQIKPDFVDTKY